MGPLKVVKKVLGKIANNADDILRIIDEPSKIAKLTPEEKLLYEQALTEKFGPKIQRMQDYDLDRVYVQSTSAQSPFAYSTNPSLTRYLKSTNKAGEELVLPKEISTSQNIDLLASKENKLLLGNKNTKEFLKKQTTPVYNPDVNMHYIPDSIPARDLNTAVFDPRFKSSPYRFAGFTPLTPVQDLLNQYETNRKKFIDKLAEVFALGSNKEIRESTKEANKEVLDFFIDPLGNSPLGVIKLLNNSEE